MSPKKFLGIKGEPETILAFSQREFRRRHLPQINYPLCSGLVDAWVLARQQRCNFFVSLADPPDDLLKFILKRQSVNYYPLISLKGDVILNETDAQLLKQKYSTDDVEELIGQMKRSGAEDIISFDLLDFFKKKNADVSGFAMVDDAFLNKVFPAAAKDAAYIQILVLRYFGKNAGGHARKSHRMGICRDGSGWHFFDPNSGYVHFLSLIKAREWFDAFWKASSYSKLNSVPGTDLLSVYTLS